MLFRQLEYFVAVARERHFARAAEACYVSQPALSASIAKLERELNVTLINRGHNYQGLTPEGERLVVWAKRILPSRRRSRPRWPRCAPASPARCGWVPSPRRPRPWSCRSPRSAPSTRWPRCRCTPGCPRPTCAASCSVRAGRRDRPLRAGRPGRPAGRAAVHRALHAAGVRPAVAQTDTMTWADAAQLPLALLTSDMRIREVIDRASPTAASW